MSRLVLDFQVPVHYDRQTISNLIRELCVQINLVSEGRIVGYYNADTAAPSVSVVSGQVGDQVRNSAPSELGTIGNKYVVTGWVCTASGSPGTWLPMRALTGN